MRTALLICGQLRTFTHVWENMKKHIVDPLNTDIFIYTWSNTGYGNRTLGLDVEDKDVNIEEIKSLTKCKKIVVKDYDTEYQTKLEDVEIPQELIDLEPIHHRNNLPLWYTLYQCNQLKKEYENENDFKYDCVIKVRPDIWFDSQLPPKVFEHLDHLLQWDFAIGKGFQVCDKMAISNSKNMDYYCGVWERLNDYYTDMGSNFRERPIGERLLFRHFKNSNIPIGSFTTNAYIKHVSFLSREENLKLKDNIKPEKNKKTIGINNLVFIHVGKCGGTTIDEAFKKHITRIKKIHTSKVNVNPNEYYFTIVRNPIDRFISAYRYAYALSHQIEEAKGNANTLEGGNLAPKLLQQGGYDLIIKDAIKKYKTPNDFAENFINNPILKNIEHIKWGISEYFTPNVLEKIRKNLIFVGRQEYLNEDLDRFKSWINVPIEFTPLRVNKINEEFRDKNQLSEKAIHNIKEFYRRDYEVIKTFVDWNLLPKEYLKEIGYEFN